MNTGAIPALRSPRYRVALAAGVVGAVVEMVPILTIQGIFLNVSPIRIFQSIASGFLGRDAYAGGLWAGVLGGALHLAISLIAALVFVAAARHWRFLLRHAVISGLTFGLFAFIVMSWIVVPLSAVAFKPNFNPALMALSVAVHMLFFGLPIALTTRRLTSRGASDERCISIGKDGGAF